MGNCRSCVSIAGASASTVVDVAAFDHRQAGSAILPRTSAVSRPVRESAGIPAAARSDRGPRVIAPITRRGTFKSLTRPSSRQRSRTTVSNRAFGPQTHRAVADGEDDSVQWLRKRSSRFALNQRNVVSVDQASFIYIHPEIYAVRGLSCFCPHS